MSTNEDDKFEDATLGKLTSEPKMQIADSNCDKMIPLTLIGRNLGERHHYLNKSVNGAYERKEDFEALEGLPEQSPIDRIFKINLASKLRITDYIIKNLKDDDLLYVSKALKSKWLLNSEYEEIINPQYLEDQLFPSMLSTAVTKIKQWIVLNLKDEERCQKFFLFYYEKDVELAIKFLRNCSSDFLKEQFPYIMHKVTPLTFKMYSERNPQIVKIFFDSLANVEELKAKYLGKEPFYFAALKHLLKTNTTMVLDITEKYFNKSVMKPFSPKATRFIMKQHKERFLQKPELYTAFLLNTQALSSCLSDEENRDLVLKLARDKYLASENWFSYKKVEPLIKRLKPEDRGALKKKVFVDNDIGDLIEKWPYHIPSPPVPSKIDLPIFEDYEEAQYKHYDFRHILKKRKYSKWNECKPAKTTLDKLFDEYRVASFGKTLFELRKKIKAESSAQNMEYMMLVLVSKSGGRIDNLVALIQLLSNFCNEPPQIRAVIVRSLVKRAHVWRIPEDSWNQLLEFAHGLGLDGELPEADCIEGIHAVVLREILTNQKCNPKIFDNYLKNYSTFVEYSLSAEENNIISDLLPKLLFTKACEQTESCLAVELLNLLLDTLTAFRLSVEKYPGLIAKIQSLANTHIEDMSEILYRLFKAKIARRDLFKVNFQVIRSADSYINALRHDIEVLSPHDDAQNIFYSITNSSFLIFYRKISIYFNENNGIAKQLLDVLKSGGFNKALARPLAILLGGELESYLKHVDNSIAVKDRTFAAALRAHMHLARPVVNVDKIGWSTIGSKAVANKVLICRSIEINNNISKLIKNKRTMKLAFVLAKRRGDFIDVFDILARNKPSAALKIGLKIVRCPKSLPNLEVWNTIKPLLENIDITSKSKKYLNIRVDTIASIPIQIKAEYSIIIFKAIKDKSVLDSIMPILCHIENLLTDVDENFTENILLEFLNDFFPNKISDKSDDDYIEYFCHYIRILVKHLLLCKCEDIQKQRLKSIGAVFFDRMEMWLSEDKDTFYTYYLKELLTAFQYHKVFLNTEYVSPLPVMESAVTWMKKKLPFEKHFNNYVHMHLNMIYCKSVREGIELLPKHCIDDSNQSEARKTIGYIFGKYLAQEVNILTTAYNFESAKYLYKDAIFKVKCYFIHACGIFAEYLINGILDQSNDTVNFLLSIYLLKDTYECLAKNVREAILNRIKENNDTEVQMILFEEIIDRSTDY